MAIIRGHHQFEQHFTQIPNSWVRDTRLSLKAIGLLVQLMSHTPGWNMSIRSLAKANDCGTDTIKSAIEELEKFGYLSRSNQKHSENGRFSDFDYTTCDPIGVTQNPVTVESRHGETGHKEEQLLLEQQDFKNNQRTLVLDFEKFWNVYPNKRGKLDAKRAFARALKLVSVDELVAGALRYANDPNLPEPRFVKHAATWLNKGCWDDPPLPADPRKSKKIEKDEAAKRLAEWEAEERRKLNEQD